MAEILIVSKTKMAHNNVCVGGIDLSNGRSVRLLDSNGYHESVFNCPYNIRDIWIIEYIPANFRPLPHSEDVKVLSRKKQKVLQPELSMLDVLKKTKICIYTSSLLNVFEGNLQHTASGTLYISESAVPQQSTCFWVCDKPLRQDVGFGKIRYHYDAGSHLIISYVGYEDPRTTLPKETLIRLSLAHWWAPEGSVDEKRCYLQLSGWY